MNPHNFRYYNVFNGKRQNSIKRQNIKCENAVPAIPRLVNRQAGLNVENPSTAGPQCLNEILQVLVVFATFKIDIPNILI